MPAWWGRKSVKSTNERNLQQTQIEENRTKAKATFNETPISSFTNSPKTTTKHTISNPPVMGTSSLDSGIEKRKKKCHPLPRPSPSPSPSLTSSSAQFHDQGIVLGSASSSLSASSASSSASSDEPSVDFGFNGYHRGRSENTFSPRTRSPCPGSRSPRAMSPLHSQLCVKNQESAVGIQENGKSLCHPLPLPPGSPTHQSTMSSIRSSESTGSSQCLASNWKKGKLLGRGTFGHVYVGFNSEKGKMCAIKEVRLISDDQNSKECLKQLNQEITLLGQLSHPNIVQYYGSELGEETLSVFLEYVTGGSIHKLLQEYGPFREPVIQSYTKQILLGLAYLHGRNTVHRDIKGANILVGPNGEVKLADFGMAKHITSNNSVLSFKGSPYWMAPEVIMNVSGHSLAVDIWSLGCTILEMATSKPPWSHFEGVAAIFKIGNSKDIPEIPDHLSDDAKSFLNFCLQRDPSARLTASQLLDHPFIRDRTTTKIPNTNIVDDIFPTPPSGSHTPISSNMHWTRTNITSQSGDNRIKPTVRPSPAKIPFQKPMDTMSLPVSPCSSPLRHYGPAHRSCFLSPPPSYMLAAQGNYGPTNHLYTSARQYMNHPSDQWADISQLKAQTPVAFPRRRPF